MLVKFNEDEYIECNIKDIKNTINALKQKLLKMESVYKIFNECKSAEEFNFNYSDFEIFALNFQVQFVELISNINILNKQINYLSISNKQQ